MKKVSKYLLYIPIGILGLIGFVLGGIGAGSLLLMDRLLDIVNPKTFNEHMSDWYAKRD